MYMYMYLLFTNLQEELATSVSKHMHMYESAPDTTSVSFFHNKCILHVPRIFIMYTCKCTMAMFCLNDFVITKSFPVFETCYSTLFH